jgi:hypothetical protein
MKSNAIVTGLWLAFLCWAPPLAMTQCADTDTYDQRCTGTANMANVCPTPGSTSAMCVIQIDSDNKHNIILTRMDTRKALTQDMTVCLDRGEQIEWTEAPPKQSYSLIRFANSPFANDGPQWFVNMDGTVATVKSSAKDCYKYSVDHISLTGYGSADPKVIVNGGPGPKKKGGQNDQ